MEEDAGAAPMELERGPEEPQQQQQQQQQQQGEEEEQQQQQQQPEQEQSLGAAAAAAPDPGQAQPPPQEQLAQPQPMEQEPATAAAAPPTANGAAAPPYEPAPSRSKKGRAGAAAAAAAARQGRSGSGSGEPQDLVQLSGPIPPNSDKLQRGWRPVRLSKDQKAPQIELDESRLEAKSSKGYRMVRATHGAHEGTWYYEVKILELGASGAARIGWATCRAELQAPVGYDTYGYAYRSKEGSKVHAAWRDEYGEEYGVGDVIGCLLHMPPGGQTLERNPEDAVKHKGHAYYIESDEEEKEPEPNAQPLPGSFVAFTRNGKLQGPKGGKAYEDIREGTYYPALSLFTNALEWGDARVACNFGEAPFEHPPPQVEGCPPARPLCEVAGPRPEGWSEEMLKGAEEEEI